MTWAELLAEVGGYAGVLMGVSIISLSNWINVLLERCRKEEKERGEALSKTTKDIISQQLQTNTQF